MKRRIIALMSVTIMLLCFVSCDFKKEIDTQENSHITDDLTTSGNQDQADNNILNGSIEINDAISGEEKQNDEETIITSGNGYSTDAEDFSVIDFFEDETDTRYLEKMPEHKRPEGYDNPILGCKTALEILAESRKALMYLDHSGAPYFALDEWTGDKNNYIETHYEDGYVERSYYFVPPLDTVEEIEEYFLPILGKEYVDNEKQYGLKQQEDGRVTAYNAIGYIGYLLSEYWDKGEIVLVKQKPDSNEAIAIFKLTNIPNNEYDGDFEYSFVKGARFVFTEEYGWQLAFEKETYNWLL
jgi:hypothetical protein